jgi:hypothetical protein
MYQRKVVEKMKKTYFMFSYASESCVIIIWKNVVELDGPQVATIHYVARSLHKWIMKATNTLSEFVILITFPLQQWLLECVTVLCVRSLFCVTWLLCLQKKGF